MKKNTKKAPNTNYENNVKLRAYSEEKTIEKLDLIFRKRKSSKKIMNMREHNRKNSILCARSTL